jgi:hypothetical protein
MPELQCLTHSHARSRDYSEIHYVYLSVHTLVPTQQWAWSQEPWLCHASLPSILSPYLRPRVLLYPRLCSLARSIMTDSVRCGFWIRASRRSQRLVGRIIPNCRYFVVVSEGHIVRSRAHEREQTGRSSALMDMHCISIRSDRYTAPTRMQLAYYASCIRVGAVYLSGIFSFAFVRHTVHLIAWRQHPGKARLGAC